MTDKIMSLSNVAKMYQNELSNSINNPKSINCQRKAEIMVTQLGKLCELYQPCWFIFDGSSNCTICEEYIGDQKFITLNCKHNIHVSCGKNRALSISKALDTNMFIECDNCKQLWVHDNIVQLFGRKEYQRIQDESNYELIQEIQKEQKIQSESRELNCKFTCQICDETKSVNDDCITLDCDHRYCNQCTQEFIKEYFKNGRVKENELVCPLCSMSISPQILQAYLTKDQFELISERRILEKQDTQFRYLRCPLKINNQPCLTILEIGITDEFVVCPFCKQEFCVNGCAIPHHGSTCEQYRTSEKYKQWQIENAMGEQGFQTFIQNEKIARCSKCQMFVQKNQGCNHMTCRCKHQFCYVCNANWAPRTCAH